MKKECYQSNYLWSLILCIIQFYFLFIALFNSGYFFANKVLLFSLGIILFWGILFFVEETKQKNSFFLQKIFLVSLFVLYSLYIINISWCGHYLTLGAISNFFSGKTFLDILYHSNLAQSIVVNGYPSVLQNAPIPLFYHSLSHYIVSGISIVFSLPCFITYNYIYPILAFPIFLYLLQKVAIVAKIYFRGSAKMQLTDYCLLIGILSAFSSKVFLDKVGFSLRTCWLSESCMVSIILLLGYICIINFGYRRYKSFERFNLFFLIPVFILILSFAKISTGFIFFVGTCYYVFRKYKILSPYCLLLLLYFGIFGSYYYISGMFPASYPVVGEETNKIVPFHFALNYIKEPLYRIVHYILWFLPTVLIFISSRKKGFFRLNKPCEEKITLFSEMAIILTLVGCLPGLVMNIAGGSAFYFYIPVYFLVWILLLGTEAINNINDKLIRDNNRTVVIFYRKDKYEHKIALIPFLFIFIFIPSILCSEMNFKTMHSMLKSTVATRIDSNYFRKNFNSKIVQLFAPVKKVICNSDYKMFNELNSLIRKNPKDYCLFTSDFSLGKKYDFYVRYEDKNKYLYPNFAASAYLGLPLINSVYIRNNIFYRGDGLRLGKHSDIGGYSMPPRICGKKITEQNMVDVAKKLNKKYIIVLENSSYDIVDVQ